MAMAARERRVAIVSRTRDTAFGALANQYVGILLSSMQQSGICYKDVL
jgi:hypothetical protein